MKIKTKTKKKKLKCTWYLTHIFDRLKICVVYNIAVGKGVHKRDPQGDPEGVT